MREWYQKQAKDVLEAMESREGGLKEEEVAARREAYGKNELEEEEKKSVARIFVEQFLDVLVLILIVAAVISAVSGNLESTLVILVVLVLNAALGTLQYVKAEKSLDSLKALSSPNAKVLRDGKKTEIPAAEAMNVDKTEEALEGEQALGDRKNMVYSGSLVTYGRAEAVVTAIGMETEIGRIAELLNQTKEKKTPLQNP